MYRCLRCGREVRRSGTSTTNLLFHLRRYHPEAQGETGRTRVEIVVDLVSRGKLSLAASQTGLLRELVAHPGPPEDVPTVPTLRGRIVSLFRKCEEAVQCQVKDASAIVLGVDVATVRTALPAVGVSACLCLCGEWRQVFLGLERASVPVDTASVSACLSGVLARFRLIPTDPRVKLCITDGSSREVGAVRLLGLRRFPCVAHATNLVVRDLLPGSKERTTPAPSLELSPAQDQLWREVCAWLGRCRGTVKQLRRQTWATRLNTVLPKDNATRWSSTFHMLHALQEHRQDIEALPDQAGVRLDGADWELLKDMVVLLGPVDELQTFSQGPSGTMMFVVDLVTELGPMIRGAHVSTRLGQFARDLLVDRVERRLGRYSSRYACCVGALGNSRRARTLSDKHRARMWMEVMNGPTDTSPQHPDSLLGRVLRNVDGLCSVAGLCSSGSTGSTTPIVYSVLPDPWKYLIDTYSSMPCSNAYLESCFSAAGRIQHDGPHTAFSLFAQQLFIRRNHE